MKSMNLFYAIGAAVLILVLVLNGFGLLSVERMLLFEFFSLSFLLFGVIYYFENAKRELDDIYHLSMSKLSKLEEMRVKIEMLEGMSKSGMVYHASSMEQISSLIDNMREGMKETSFEEIKLRLDKLDELLKEISVKSQKRR